MSVRLRGVRPQSVWLSELTDVRVLSARLPEVASVCLSGNPTSVCRDPPCPTHASVFSFLPIKFLSLSPGYCLFEKFRKNSRKFAHYFLSAISVLCQFQFITKASNRRLNTLGFFSYSSLLFCELFCTEVVYPLKLQERFKVHPSRKWRISVQVFTHC